MPTTRLQQLRELGQSVWINNLSRAMINSGELQRFIDFGIVGVTSNPTTFECAIAGSDAYDGQIGRLLQEGRDTVSIYEELVVSDVRRACDLLRTTFQRSNGVDGYVSLGVSPFIAFDRVATVQEARRLRAAVDRRNVMIKIPATEPGILAIGDALRDGINVNATLLFSVDDYREVAGAFIQALEDRLDAGEPIDEIASVASFHVGQVDSLVDRRLQEVADRDPTAHSGMLANCLLGTLGTANARLAYSEFEHVFEGARFGRLRRAGARVQRPLWAGTSPANARYPVNLYTEALIGPDTVSTMSANAVQSFLAIGKPERTVHLRRDEAFHALSSLGELGISYPDATRSLLEQSLADHAQSFRALLEAIEHAKKGVTLMHPGLAQQHL